MAELTTTIEAHQPTEASAHKIPGWFPDDIAKRIDQYSPQVQPNLIADLNMSLGQYGLDHLIEALNRPSLDRFGEGLPQNENCVL